MEYKNLINKSTPLTLEEQQKVKWFEDYIKLKKYCDPYGPVASEKIENDYEHEMAFLNTLKERNQNQENALQNSATVNQTLSFDEVRKQALQKEEQLTLSRKLNQEKKAGYMNASIILFLVLNLGLFFAGMLLLLK